ncbi:uncharacterized protein LOC131210399 [Anopheles bellator]|uniref:uncharacterized protein LOC131210399 n=1 Tax=Anopheles bellator TaxID=139047 RepID=UPI002649C219|nr:uncharacterized protein LOC131210399 [Anopheles bellator]
MSAHSSFYQGTKRISPLKIRNPSILPSQIMPSPTGAPFNFAEMPWSFGVKPGQVMEFNAVIRPSPITVPLGPTSTVFSMPATSGSPPTFVPSPLQSSPIPDVRKRKTELNVESNMLQPSKQFVTEEIMSSHFKNLHLSTEYTAHDINRVQNHVSTPATFGEGGEMMLGDTIGGDMDKLQPYHVCMSPQELEDRLKKAQRIAICEEVRKLENRAEILPQVLLQRLEKPCTALMIWQPPQDRLDKLLTSVTEQMEKREKTERSAEKKTAAAAMMSMDDEPLPDLPDYDEDLDFEPNVPSSATPSSNAVFVPDLATMDVEM